MLANFVEIPLALLLLNVVGRITAMQITHRDQPHIEHQRVNVLPGLSGALGVVKPWQ
jgi:hypothetical protein